MATLDNVTDTLNTQNANQEKSQAEQTAILNQLAASNAAIVAEMAKNAAEQAKRDQEAAAAAESAKKQARTDEIEEINRKELEEAEKKRDAAEKAKAANKGSSKPGMFGKMREGMGMGPGSGLLGLARGGLLAGAFGTAIASFTSGENFAKAGEIVGKIGEGAKALFEKIEFAVPSGKDIIDTMNKGFGGTLDAINAALDGDMDAFTEAAPQLGTTLAVLGGTFRNFTASINKGLFAMRDKVTNAGKGLMNKIQGDNAKSAVPKRSGMDARLTQTNMIKNMNKDQLAAMEKRGLKVQADGSVKDMKTGKLAKVADVDAGLKGVMGRDSTTTTNKQAKADAKLAGKGKVGKGLSKTGSFIMGKLGALGKRIPILGQLLSAGTIAAIIAGDNPRDVKIQKVAEALGGLGGGTLGAIAGSALGTMIFPGVGTVAGGLLGGFGGAFFGEEIAGALAKAILGKPETPDAIAEFVKGSEGQATVGNIKASSGSTGSGVSAIPPTRGSQISQGQAQLAQASAGVGGGPTVVAPSSTTNNIGGAHTVATNGLSTVDPFEAGTSA